MMMDKVWLARWEVAKWMVRGSGEGGQVVRVSYTLGLRALCLILPVL
jgi:hypothetical protein